MLAPAVEAVTSAPLVGREQELDALEAALDALDQGTPGCVAIEGEPGIGKTRLLSELRARSEKRGHLVLTGVAAEFERHVPFSVWVDALDAYAASQDLASRAAWSDELATELGAVLPSLRADGATPDDALADERYRAHRAVTGLLSILSEDQALVLVLDDLHWSDGASLELIASLVRRGTSAPVLLVLSLRPGQAPERLTGALAAPGVVRLALGHLTEEQAGALLAGVDEASAAAIYRHGGGNPFYLEQLARVPAEQLAGEAASAEGGVPAAVRAALTDELDSLSDAGRALLDGAAVAGEPFEPDLAAAIAEIDPAEALRALDDLLAVDLVRATDVPRRFTFRHPLVRRAVYEAPPGGWRLAAHARAAAALGARGAAPADRAHHVEQSASPGDEEAIAVLLDAGAAASARAPTAAARWYRAAQRLLPDADHTRQVDVRLARASALRALGDLQHSRHVLLEAIDLLGDHDVPRRVDLTAQCAAVEHWMGSHEDAHRRLMRAWEDLPQDCPSESSALQIELSVDGMYTLDFDQVLGMGRGALEAARGLGDRALHAAAASALCLGEVSAGLTADAREHRTEALEQIDRLSDAELAPRLEALCYLGWAENYLEHFDDAISHVDRGIDIARATGEGRVLIPMMLTKGYPLQQQGRIAESLELS